MTDFVVRSEKMKCNCSQSENRPRAVQRLESHVCVDQTLIFFFFPKKKQGKKKKGSKLLRQKEIALEDEERLTQMHTEMNFG